METSPDSKHKSRVAGGHPGVPAWCMYFAQDVFIPVAMALFLALLLTPAVDRLQRWGLRRGLAVTLVMFVVCAAAAAAVNAAWRPATEWLARAPQTHAPDRSAAAAAARDVRHASMPSPNAPAGSRRAAPW